MKIVLFHPVKLPPKDYGGVERVVLWLSLGLLEQGYSVFVAARAGSLLPRGVNLISLPEGVGKVSELLKLLPNGVDLIHLMAPTGEDLDQLSIPYVLTIHGNGKPNEVFPKNTVFLSRNHALRHGRASFVYNGIDPSEFEMGSRDRQSGALFLSKTTLKTKNLRGAMRICSKANASLTIAGGNRPFGLRALAFLHGWNWSGPVSGAKKAQLYTQSKVVLFPVCWEEPFGLVPIEALASGVPVLASNRGSLPELIDNQTGRILNLQSSDDEMRWSETLNEILEGKIQFDPQACRRRVMEKFHYRVMAERYSKIYKQILSGLTLDSSERVSPL